MSITYCHNCNRNIDEDFDVEHFDECRKAVEDFATFVFSELKKERWKDALPEYREHRDLVNDALLRVENNIKEYLSSDGKNSKGETK